MKVEPILPRESDRAARPAGVGRAGRAASSRAAGPYKADGLVFTLMILGVLQVIGGPGVFIWLQIKLSEGVSGYSGAYDRVVAWGLVSLPVGAACVGVFLAGVVFLAMSEIVQAHVDARNELSAQRMLLERLAARAEAGSRPPD